MNKLLRCIMLFVSCLLVAGCSGGGNSSGGAPPQLISIAVIPANSSLTAGANQQFTATGTYADATTTDLTTAATWASATPTVATISTAAGTKGKLTALTAGTTSVTATVGSVLGVTNVTISAASSPKLGWPINCTKDGTCGGIGYPDIDNNGTAFNCGPPGYIGHQGTDITISSAQMTAGMDVYAAADGEVLWVFDGKYDNCPNSAEPDCTNPASFPGAGGSSGTTVCTPLGPYCPSGTGNCYLCFAGGNVVVIRHTGVPGVFATRYDHLKKNSIIVTPGQTVTKGQKIAQAASAGNSSGPHLHFEVWDTGFYQPAEPWAGSCGPNTSNSLWDFSY